MRNRYLENIDRIVMVKVSGKNIYQYISRLMKKRVQIIKLIPISYKEVHLILKYSEYEKLLEIKSVLYQVTILNYMGSLKVRKSIRRNSILAFFLLIGVFSLVFLSRFIFSIEVIHQDREIRELVLDELKKYDVKVFRLKKSFYELENIEEKILNDYKDRLEWIEIVESGTRYVVRVEERKILKKKEKKYYQNIVSRKEAVIVSVKAISGEKVKVVDDYVKKGDVIIAGYVTLPDQSRILSNAIGEVLGEVWYSVKIDYPFVYQESRLTGRFKDVYSFQFLGKRISLFDFRRYRSFSSKNRVLFSSFLLGVCFVKERQYEMKVLDDVYTEDIVQSKAISYVKDKLMKDNPFMKRVEDVMVLSSYSDEDSIVFHFFVKAIEDIGESVDIDLDKFHNNIE